MAITYSRLEFLLCLLDLAVWVRTAEKENETLHLSLAEFELGFISAQVAIGD